MASQNELAFRKWWWLVAAALVIGVSGALLSLHLTRPSYQASCKLFVAGRPDSGTGEGYQAAQFAQARVAAYLDLIKGARVAEGAINALGLDMPSEDLQSRVTASAAAESVIMTVSVIDQQAQRSADLANAVCTSFLSVAADAEGANPLVNVRVIEYANPPVYPVGPSKSRYLTVGALAGVLAGLAVVVLLGRVRSGKGRQRSQEPDEVPATDDHSATSSSDGEMSTGSASHRRRDM